MMLATGAGLSFGIFNFILSLSISESRSLRSLYGLWIGYAMYGFGYHIVTTYQLWKEKRKFWTRHDSAYFDNDNGQLKYRLIKLTIIRYSLIIVALFQMFGMFYSSYLSGISSAIIISIYAAAVLTTALAFYFAHEETPSFKHFVGMICIII